MRSTPLTAVVLLALLPNVEGALLPEAKRILSGTWRGHLSTKMVGIKSKVNQWDKPVNRTLTKDEQNSMKKFVSACLLDTQKVEQTYMFDTSAEKFAFHQKPFTTTYSSEAVKLPELSTTGKVMNYDNGNLQVQSFINDEKKGCITLLPGNEITNTSQVRKYISIVYSGNFDGEGSFKGKCPTTLLMKCDPRKIPPIYSFTGRLYKLDAAEEKKVHQERGWAYGNIPQGDTNRACVHTEIPFDLYMPLDCWTPKAEEGLPAWIAVAAVGVVIVLCCGCCISCCVWCCRTFGISESRWCRCCRACFRGFTRVPTEDEDDSSSSVMGVSTTAPKVIKVRAHRPMWAQKYGEHAAAWKAANSI